VEFQQTVKIHCDRLDSEVYAPSMKEDIINFMKVWLRGDLSSTCSDSILSLTLNYTLMQ
jgi:hypothetical protein